MQSTIEYSLLLWMVSKHGSVIYGEGWLMHRFKLRWKMDDIAFLSLSVYIRIEVYFVYFARFCWEIKCNRSPVNLMKREVLLKIKGELPIIFINLDRHVNYDKRLNPLGFISTHLLRDEKLHQACITSSPLDLITELLLSTHVCLKGTIPRSRSQWKNMKITMWKWQRSKLTLRECVLSTLAQMMPMIGLCTLFIFSVRSQRSRWLLENMDITLWIW